MHHALHSIFCKSVSGLSSVVRIARGVELARREIVATEKERSSEH